MSQRIPLSVTFIHEEMRIANRDRFHFGTTSARAAVQPACALTLLAFSVTLALFETVPDIRQPRGRGRKAVRLHNTSAAVALEKSSVLFGRGQNSELSNFNNQSEIQAVAGTGPSKAASSQD